MVFILFYFYRVPRENSIHVTSMFQKFNDTLIDTHMGTSCSSYPCSRKINKWFSYSYHKRFVIFLKRIIPIFEFDLIVQYILYHINKYSYKTLVIRISFSTYILLVYIRKHNQNINIMKMLIGTSCFETDLQHLKELFYTAKCTEKIILNIYVIYYIYMIQFIYLRLWWIFFFQ